MSAGFVIRLLAVASAAVAVMSPTELIADAPAGWIQSGPSPTDLGLDAYAELSSHSVSHIEPDDEAAASITAARRTWTRGRSTVTVEVFHAPDEDVALSFVDQAAATSIASGLATADPPFLGAWSYGGQSSGSWTRIVAWAHGPYAVVITEVSEIESDPAVIASWASAQATHVVDLTGLPAGDAPVPEDPSPPENGSPIPLGLIVVAPVLLAAAAWSFRRQRAARRHQIDGAGRDGPADR